MLTRCARVMTSPPQTRQPRKVRSPRGQVKKTHLLGKTWGPEKASCQLGGTKCSYHLRCHTLLCWRKVAYVHTTLHAQPVTKPLLRALVFRGWTDSRLKIHTSAALCTAPPPVYCPTPCVLPGRTAAADPYGPNDASSKVNLPPEPQQEPLYPPTQEAGSSEAQDEPPHPKLPRKDGSSTHMA